MISEEQKRFFEVFGFLCLRRHFTEQEMQRLRAKAEYILDQDLQGQSAPLAERQQVNGFVERDSDLASLIEDDRVYEIAEATLGKNFVWIGSDGNRYLGDTGWHPDGSNFDYTRIKFLFYLDSLQRNTGALRVIPGSHLPMFHSILFPLIQRSDSSITAYGVRAPKRHDPNASGFGCASFDIPSVAIETNPGDMVIFNQNIWHSSFGGRPGRLMFTMSFGECPRNEEDLTYLRTMYEGQLRHIKERQFTTASHVYGNTFLSGAWGPRIAEISRTLRSLEPPE